MLKIYFSICLIPRKESTCNAGAGDMQVPFPGSGRSAEGGHSNSTPVFLPEESHGQTSLAGYGPCKAKAGHNQPLSRQVGSLFV